MVFVILDSLWRQAAIQATLKNPLDGGVPFFALSNRVGVGWLRICRPVHELCELRVAVVTLFDFLRGHGFNHAARFFEPKIVEFSLEPGRL